MGTMCLADGISECTNNNKSSSLCLPLLALLVFVFCYGCASSDQAATDHGRPVFVDLCHSTACVRVCTLLFTLLLLTFYLFAL
jgi:hypothetical protein